MKWTKKENQRRYLLHRKVKKEGCRVLARRRTIYISYKQEVLSESILELRDRFNYSVQTEIE